MEDLNDFTRRVKEFMKLPAPASQTMSQKEWKQLALGLGEEAIPHFIEAFHEGGRWDIEQESALFALRLHGYDATYLEDDEGVRAYRIRPPGEKEFLTIHPRIQPYRPSALFSEYLYAGKMDKYEILFQQQERERIARQQQTK